ncbi:MAG: ATP-grasp domain-containing protein, partial [Kiritimatiellaeota bacterium]|nr:ATP-grasp domain-containing protein [Kiritimatiellota bacterium]
KLYFEPLTFEDVMNIYENEQPLGVIVQMGGQTPLNLAVPLQQAGVPILGTSSESIDIAEDRKRCAALLNQLGIRQPESGTATSIEEALEVARRIGFPVMIRPSYVLGGRAMMVAYNQDELVPCTYAAFNASPGHPVLIDRYLDRAIEVDVDVVCDGTEVYIGGVQQHVEQAGVHSGDSACCTPPHSLDPELIRQIEADCRRMALALNVKGLMNVQLAVKGRDVYVLEINPRASRTVPYLSKATGVPLAKWAARIAVGQTLKQIMAGHQTVKPTWMAVKEVVLPFNRFLPFVRFLGADIVLSPEMKSTGEVMGLDSCFELAYWKAQIAAGQMLPDHGAVFLSARDADKDWIVEVGAELARLGFELIATGGTARALEAHGLAPHVIGKLSDPQGETVLDRMHAGRVQMIVNTPSGPVSRVDEIRIRSEAILRSIPIVTTESGARATVACIRYMRTHDWDVHALQDYFPVNET